MADIQRALKQVLDKEITLWNNGNVAGVPEIHTEDCKVLPPNAKIVEGNANTETMVEGLIGDGMVTAKRTDWELEPLGPDFAMAIGRWTFLNKEGELAGTFKCMTVFKKLDGTWKIHRVLYNSN